MEHIVYDNAELALAAYADLKKELNTKGDQNIRALRDAGMTETQAKQFAARWPVIEEHFSDLMIGLSVTVFRNNNQVNIAIRGTDGITDMRDMWSNLLVGVGIIPKQYSVLSDLYQSLYESGAITDTDQVFVSGHSLGGLLAQVLACEFNNDFEQVYTFNSPGIGGVPLDLFNITHTSLPANITNVQGDGFSLIEDIGVLLGTIEEIQIENSDLAVSDHTIKKLVDSLGVYNLLQQLDSSISIDSYNRIFTSSSLAEGASLESIVNSIGSLLQVGSFIDADNSDDNREALFTRINAIYAEIFIDPNADSPQLKPDYQNSVLFNLAAYDDPAQIAINAKTSLAFAYALVNLESIVFLNIDNVYQKHNQDGALDLDNLSDAYLADRAQMLYWKLVKNHHPDVTPNDPNSSDVIEFNDVTTGEILQVNLSKNSNPSKRIVFGDESHGFYVGGDNDDRLYGGDGNDGFHGKGGDDYIEGNKGNDIIDGDSGNDELHGGEGDDELYGGSGSNKLYGGTGFDRYYVESENDVIKDTDGLGRVVANDIDLTGTYIANSDNEFQLVDGEIRVSIDQDNTLTVLNTFDNGTLTIENFESGDLGIVLATNEELMPPPPPPPVPVPPQPRRDPLALDLNGDGKVETLDINQGVFFDLDNSGFAEQTGWIAPSDALVVLDRNQNSIIDGGAELFGTETLLSNGEYASNGFEALADFDDNNDGQITNADTVFNELNVWQDLNSDGVADENELSSLINLNITSIDLNYTQNSFTDENNVLHREQGLFNYGDGTTGLSNTLWFDSDRRNTVPVDIHNGAVIDVSAEIADLPDAVGFGNTYSLHQTMMRDQSGQLQELVEAFVQESDVTKRWKLVNKILITWTGQDSTDPKSRGSSVNGQHLAVLEAFWGQAAVQTQPTGQYAQRVNEVYQSLTQSIYTQLMADSHAETLFNKLSFTQLEDEWTHDFAQVSQYIINTLGIEDATKDAELLDFIDVVSGVSPYSDAMREDFIAELEKQAELISPEAETALLRALRSGDDVYTGSGLNDNYNGFAGDDRISGGRGNDILNGGEGNDKLTDNSGENTLYGEAGDDTIKGRGELYGGTGKDSLTGYYKANNTLNGGEGDDTLRLSSNSSSSRSYQNTFNGGRGNDSITGSYSTDTYIYNLGDGHDVIQDHGYSGTATSYTDKLIFGEHITPEMVSFTYNSDGDLLITITELNNADNHGTIRVVDGFSHDRYRIESIEFLSDPSGNSNLSKDTILTLASDMYGTQGDDIYYGTEQNNNFNGFAGNDQIYAGSGNDILNGGSGDDSIHGNAGNDIIHGGEGNDTLTDNTGENILYGDAGNDTISGYGELYGDAGNDTINGIGKIYGGTGNDTIDGEGEIYGGSGNDTISGQGEIYGGSGDDIISGYGELYGDAGNDTINGIGKIYGGTGNDTLDGHGEIYGGTGNDTISGQGEIYGGSGNDTIYGSGKLYGETGKDILNGTYCSNNTLNGGEGDDILGLSDKFFGIEYSYISSSFQNIFEGGHGNDTITGNYSTDTYLYNLGDGHDVIQDYSDGNSNIDKLVFCENITSEMVGISLNKNDDLLITITDPNNADNNGTIRIVNGYSQSQYRIELIEFLSDSSGGSNLNEDAIIARAEQIIYGTSGDDKLTGTSLSEIIYGGEGNDTLTDHSGENILYGEAGDDTIKGRGELYGGTGKDILTGFFRGNNTLNGGEGDDTLGLSRYSSSSRFDNNTFEGGRGNDSIRGSFSTDTYLYNLGDGHDVIHDSGYSATATRYNDKLVFDEHITPDMVSLTHNTEDDLLITITDPNNADNNGTIRVTDGYSRDSRRIEIIDFLSDPSGDSNLNKDEILALGAHIYGTSGDDKLTGTFAIDIIHGGEGNDTITSIYGENILYGEAGDDTIYGRGELNGGTGKDILTGSYRANNSLNGGDGNDTLGLSLYLPSSRSYRNTFNGGRGNDTITGSYSKDTYLYNLGDGHDVIQDYGYIGNATTYTDKLIFGEHITSDMVSFTHNADGDLLITITDAKNADNNGTIRVINGYSHNNYRIESIEFLSDPSGNSNLTYQEVNILINIATDTAVNSANNRSIEDIMLMSDVGLNQLIQAYSSFDTDGEDHTCEKYRTSNSVVLPVVDVI